MANSLITHLEFTCCYIGFHITGEKRVLITSSHESKTYKVTLEVGEDDKYWGVTPYVGTGATARLP